MKPLVLLSFSLAFLTQAFADDDFAEESSKQAEARHIQSEDEWCISPYRAIHASARHNEANGIGYKEGYTTVEVFGIYDGFGTSFMPFFDLRGHIFNDGNPAGNLGIGERSLISSINHTYGSYIYYDVRRVGHGQTTQQISPGVELVGERMEYRINCYFPIVNRKGRKFSYKFDKFAGNNILLKFKQNQTMMGGDAEVGVHIPQNTTYDVYAAAGPYYFHSSNASAWGGRVRVLGRYKEYITLEVDYSYDKLFRNIVQGSIAFTVPFGGKLKRCTRCCDDNLLLSRASFAPSRFEIPVVKRVNKREKAINPATDNPWVVWFVNNTSNSAGTFESPFSTLLAAQNASSPNDMIYVFPGDGTTNGMNAGITLQDGQNFFGSGIKQKFATKQGTITIPAMSSRNPSITNGGDVVDVGSGNIVSGFNISAIPAADAIFSPAPINGITITNNVITLGADSRGVEVTGVGTFIITNNQITGPIGASSRGIQVFAKEGFSNGVISNNFVSGLDFGITVLNVSGNRANFDFTIQGNTVTGFDTEGIDSFLSGNSTLRIVNNTVTTSIGTTIGIHVADDPTTTAGNVMISNNQVNVGTASTGIQLMLTNGNNSFWNTDISNNSVQGIGATSIGVNVVSAATDTVCLSIDNNTVINPTAGSTAFKFNATAGTINIDSLSGNIGGPVSATGNVNLVAPGSCGN